MNILLVSECNKRALTETRRILDQFAERRGERTWQTAITQAGLDTLRRLLRKTARKNTAVACHWIRGLDHSELLWIVGDISRFNEQGSVPTNITRRNILRKDSENNWHHLRIIRLLAGLSALLHDIGKACKAFQARLLSSVPTQNIYRHEWVSLRLFQAFVGNDNDETWLRRLAEPSEKEDTTWLGHLQKDGHNPETPYPFTTMPPLARIIGWLFLSHHRIPAETGKGNAFRADMLEDVLSKMTTQWNNTVDESDSKKSRDYWIFPSPLPVHSVRWRTRAASLAKELLQYRTSHPDIPDWPNWLEDPFIMHFSRLALMLSDHLYSSLTDPQKRIRIKLTDPHPLYANTCFSEQPSGKRKYNQLLEEHLLGVEKTTRQISHFLPRLADDLPRLARHKGLGKRSTGTAFRWQNTAAELAAGVRLKSRQHGAFIINMASTGCGKTFANARIMYALADPAKGMRCAFALGLRTLTRQTGNEYRQRLHLDEDEIATLMGGKTMAELGEYYEQQAEASGSASTQSLLPEDSHILYEGSTDTNPALNHLFKNEQSKKLLMAPVLVSTVDHLVPATESLRGGRHIAPTLRLLSGDLVLDEIDDYDIDDLPAITHLVFWAGLCGSRILLSSATTPPSLAQGLFEAYLAGRRHYQKNCGERPDETPDVCCLWIDEFTSRTQDCGETAAFAEKHQKFSERRVRQLAKAENRRIVEIIPFSAKGNPQEIREKLAETLFENAIHLHHAHHSVDPGSGKAISFGLIRMANIRPLVEVAQNFFGQTVPDDFHIHLCVYHSQFPLLLRSAIENRIDNALNRREEPAVFRLPDIRSRIDRHTARQQIFLVIGSPVTEVGRDHDYDWGIVEPSSMRSIIQLAGRIRRHRPGTCHAPNILILERNLASLEHPGSVAYHRPGFESASSLSTKFESHSLFNLLKESDILPLNSRARIQEKEKLQPTQSLVDLEHYRLRRLMLHEQIEKKRSKREERLGISAEPPSLGAYTCWVQKQALLSGQLQKWRPFRKQEEKQINLVLLPNEDEDGYVLTELFKKERNQPAMNVPVEKSRNSLIPDSALTHPAISFWNDTNYMDVLAELAEELEMDLKDCAMRYGTLTLPESTHGWRSHPALGFIRNTE